MRIRPLAWSLVLAGLIASASLPTAAADGPVVQTFHDEGVAELWNCGAFKILDQYVLDFTERWFYDRAGTLIRIEEHVSGTDTLVNSLTGKSYTGRFANNVIVDPVTRLGANAGIIYRITVPGAGAIFLDVGRIVTDRFGTIIAFRAGPHQAVDGDFARLCAALA
jgi:hypothetical protein